MTRYTYFKSNYQKGVLIGISGCLGHNTLLGDRLKDVRTNERQITVYWIELENAFDSIHDEL